MGKASSPGQLCQSDFYRKDQCRLRFVRRDRLDISSFSKCWQTTPSLVSRCIDVLLCLGLHHLITRLKSMILTPKPKLAHSATTRSTVSRDDPSSTSHQQPTSYITSSASISLPFTYQNTSSIRREPLKRPDIQSYVARASNFEKISAWLSYTDPTAHAEEAPNVGPQYLDEIQPPPAFRNVVHTGSVLWRVSLTCRISIDIFVRPLALSLSGGALFDGDYPSFFRWSHRRPILTRPISNRSVRVVVDDDDDMPSECIGLLLNCVIYLSTSNETERERKRNRERERWRMCR